MSTLLIYLLEHAKINGAHIFFSRNCCIEQCICRIDGTAKKKIMRDNYMTSFHQLSL